MRQLLRMRHVSLQQTVICFRYTLSSDVSWKISSEFVEIYEIFQSKFSEKYEIYEKYKNQLIHSFYRCFLNNKKYDISQAT